MEHWIPTIRNRKGQILDIYSSLMEKGKIFVNMPINQKTAGLINVCLDHIITEQDINRPEIFLSANNGDVISAMMIVDIIEFYKKNNIEIRTLAFGEIGIAASLVLASGTKGNRFIAPNCQLSLYLGLDGLEFCNINDTQAKYMQAEKIKNRCLELFVKFSNKNLEELRHQTDNEMYINAEEAIKMGIAEYII